MGLSPRRRHYKPRHARPRPKPWERVCATCLGECLHLLAGHGTGLLFLPQSTTWLNTAATAALFGLCAKRHRTGHRPSQS